ncbi:CocE/NonD family hydrolase [Paraburkholderia megapolitana]|uniref:Xaa-Pro dipeptidyl-peptidase C-terminal domain-containing protein n=1 Tax=Paraburkholderia megapolitana TaxID=420953 RepID=A0A1I3QK42_9BURK|nr:CocE/NonD family hydrolase [Paraburkholderia megapolitana]SFJ34190.1 hypothetical protein SAMN05192543_106414 [Paraburkholderia megapolitana]
MNQERSEIRDGMQITWDAAIQMDDGVVLRADIFRPVDAGRYPVIMSYGPYGKGLAFQDGYRTAWQSMERDYPDAVTGTSNAYANWEVVDPEKWVPHGYVVVRVDSRGAGRSPGYLCHNNHREQKDYHECIEWAAAQPWSTGKVGLNGISYYGANQWRAAATQPLHLAAICVWEGWHDNYRDGNRHGGILCTFRKNWQDMQVKTVQHGVGERGATSRLTGELACGPETLTNDELVSNREDMHHEMLSRALLTDYYKERSVDLTKVQVPLLSAANWGGQGLHARGNFEGFIGAASTQKWLEVHGGSHWAPFYTDYGVALQKRFFDYFLKGENNGWQDQPKVQLQVRHLDRYVLRYEDEWPLARTAWTSLYLDPHTLQLSDSRPQFVSTVQYRAMGKGVTFMTPPLSVDTEFTGPSSLTLIISSSTADADFFVVLHVFDPAGNEVTFQGALDPKAPLTQGWLRASQRKLEPDRSRPYRPFHSHDESQPLEPGVPYEVDIEIWPTCVVLPKGYRLGLTIMGRDYEHGLEQSTLSNMKNPMKGCGPFLHDDPVDRPSEIFDNIVTLHFDPERPATLLVPVIPERS